MNREIEFRGINTLSKEFIYGDLVKYSENQWSIWALKNGGHEVYLIDTKTIGQYTGLKDRNGVKIFEGDIVKWGHVAGGLESPIRVARVDLFPSLHFTIVQNRKNFIKHTFEFGAFMYQNTEKYLEVIGNIHSNPELINC